MFDELKKPLTLEEVGVIEEIAGCIKEASASLGKAGDCILNSSTLKNSPVMLTIARDYKVMAQSLDSCGSQFLKRCEEHRKAAKCATS